MKYSALFLEAGAAGAAGDGDLSLASGHPQPLAAAGALEVDVLLVPADVPAHMEPADQRTGGLHKFCVLHPPPLYVAGEQPKQGDQ